jgi:acyl carrier protein
MDYLKMKEKIIDIVVEQLGIDKEEVIPEAKIIEDLGADSLDTVELVMIIEEEFDLEIPDEEAEKILSVNDIFNYLENAIRLQPA